MIIADKIITLRKKNGWSQEELAERLGVSRQAVSKWESAQSIPDIDKILKLADIFAVSTDCLLRDDIELPTTVAVEPTDAPSAQSAAPSKPLRRVTLDEAHEFLDLRLAASKSIALGVTLCILGAVVMLSLIFLGEVCQNENLFAGLGIMSLLVIVAVAVVLFVSTGMKSAQYEFLENEEFETEYGVSGMVTERKKAFRDTYNRFNLIGVTMCILAPILLFAAMFTENEALASIALCVMLTVVAVAVYMFVRVGVVWGSFERLLEEGDYTREMKRKAPFITGISSAYWLAVTALYLAVSLPTGAWGTSWVIWAVAGVLFGAVCGVVYAIEKRK